MQSDKIVQSRISNKSNVERWNQEKKSITQNNLKNKGEKNINQRATKNLI